MLGPVMGLQADLEVHLFAAHIVVAGRNHLVLVCLVEDSPVDPLGEGSRLGLGVDPKQHRDYPGKVDIDRGLEEALHRLFDRFVERFEGHLEHHLDKVPVLQQPEQLQAWRLGP